MNVLRTVTFIQNLNLIWYFGVETKCPREQGYVTTKIETLQLQSYSMFHDMAATLHYKISNVSNFTKILFFFAVINLFQNSLVILAALFASVNEMFI